MTEGRLPMRPNTGTLGKKISLITNFFEVRLVPSNDLHMYNVQIIPDVSRAQKLRIISKLCSQRKDLFNGDRTPAYDGEASLFCAHRTSWSKISETVKLEDRTDPFTVQLEHVSVVIMSNLHHYISGADIDMPQDCIQALDVILRTTPLATSVAIGSSFFSGRMTHPLDIYSEIWFGYHQSLRPAHDRILVNLDVAATCFHRSQAVLDIAAAVTKKNPAQITGADRGVLRSDLIGVKVFVTHRGEMRRKYRIRDIAKVSAEEQTFQIEEEERDVRTMTVSGYFKERYGFQLKYPGMPLLLVGSKAKPTFLPMEVCHTVGGERITKKLSPAQTAAMIKKTATKPQIRRDTILNCMKERSYAADPVLNQFDLHLDPNMMQIQGRVLDPPVILYNQQKSKRSQIQPQMGSWQATHFFTAPPINSWGVVVLERRTRPNELNAFLATLNESGKSVGVVFRVPLVIPYDQCRGRGRGRIHYHDVLQRSMNQVKEATRSLCQLLLIVLPFDDPAAYSEIKRVCDTVLDVPSQCMLSKHLQRPDRAYCANLLQKINTRVGGVNNILKTSPSHEFLFKHPAIIFGADVSHAAPFSNVPSIAAVVASMDAYPYKYACEIQSQKSRQELIEHLKDMSIKLLKKFYIATRGKKPERIVFYRDGVSEGQFEQVLHHELSALRKACDELETGYTPKITFIIVQKRHHARFFIGPGSAGMADRSGNVPAGTVVDTSIVHPRQFDFYLVAHAGIQGTSRPTHYHVIFDENNFNANVLQDFTYRQSHVYARCTRSVSLVPAVYYAHLAALRARYHMKADELECLSGLSSESVPHAVPVVKDRAASQMYFI